MAKSTPLRRNSPRFPRKHWIFLTSSVVAVALSIVAVVLSFSYYSKSQNRPTPPHQTEVVDKSSTKDIPPHPVTIEPKKVIGVKDKEPVVIPDGPVAPQPVPKVVVPDGPVTPQPVPKIAPDPAKTQA